MTNKLLWNSFCFLIVIVVCNSCMHKFGLLRYRQRKCVQNRPLLKIDITFSNRQECLKSVEESQSQGVKSISELNLNTVEEINYRGYNATTYTILSKDGYYSAVYRISGRKNSPPKLGKRSVLVFHGAGAGSASWIIQPGSRNIALTLADAGYEVWLANARGTIPSKKHVHLDADKDLQYWDFSFDDFGTKDLPLLVDLILRETGTDKIYYVCHSMGCAAYLTGLVNVPDLNDKIKAGFLMAPSAYYGNVYNPTFTLFPPILGTPLQHIVFRLFGGTFSAEPNAIQTFLGLTPEKICSWKYIRCGICDNFLFALYGADPQQLNYTDLPNIIKKVAGQHSSQNILSLPAK